MYSRIHVAAGQLHIKQCDHTSVPQFPLQTPHPSNQVKKGDHGDEEQHLHVMVKYIVPPSEHEDFLEAWAEAQDMTAKEKGNRKYLLRKVFNDNVHYVLCGTWETFDDFVDHFK